MWGVVGCVGGGGGRSYRTECDMGMGMAERPPPGVYASMGEYSPGVIAGVKAGVTAGNWDIVAWRQVASCNEQVAVAVTWEMME